jgi:hypothetical protein
MKTARRVIKVSLLVDEDVYEKLSTYAQLTDCSIFEVIRAGLAEWTGSMLPVRHENVIKMPRSNATDEPLPTGTE